MSKFTLEWLVKDRVALLSDFPAEMTGADLEIAIEIMKRLFEESTSDHIHYINDISKLRKIPMSLASLTHVMPLVRNKRLASVSMVGKLQNPLVKVFAKTFAGALALYFAKDVNTALQDLYAMYPDLAQPTHA